MIQKSSPTSTSSPFSPIHPHPPINSLDKTVQYPFVSYPTAHADFSNASPALKIYEKFNYTWPDRNHVKLYKKSEDRFSEGALCFRQSGPEKMTIWKILEHTLGAIFLLIPRLIWFIFCFAMCLLVGKLLLIGLPKQKTPYTEPKVNGWRRYMLRSLSRLEGLFEGFLRGFLRDF